MSLAGYSVIVPSSPDYPIEWREDLEAENGFPELKPYYQDPETKEFIEATWAPQRGSQTAFLAAVPIYEVLYEGTRGPGKTDALLMDFLQHVDKGYGIEWKGILFRQTYKQLVDVIDKSQKWFSLVYPKARYNKSDHVWTFPGGEQLFLRYMVNKKDYWNYHGHAYPWIAWEELCNWGSDECYAAMMSCSRSTKPGMPRCYRATTNPYGKGHNWVKERFRLPQSQGIVITDSYRGGELEPPRLAIHGTLQENVVLLRSDPEYIGRIRASARNPAEIAAWIDGSWDITSGGMFDDIEVRRARCTLRTPLVDTQTLENRSIL